MGTVYFCLVYLTAIVVTCIITAFILFRLRTDAKIIFRLIVWIVTIGYICLLIGMVFNRYLISNIH